MALQVDTSAWEAGKDYPEWMNEISLSTISKGYLLPGETPRKAYKRVSDTVAARLDRPDLAAKFFKYMWKGWLNLASPVLSNTGTDKGLPISCFGIDTPDSIRGIGLTNAELMRLTSLGGGVGIGLSKIRFNYLINHNVDYFIRNREKRQKMENLVNGWNNFLNKNKSLNRDKKLDKILK